MTIIDDSDNDFYCISIIIKLKNVVPIKDINSILKINKKVCSQAYLEECDLGLKILPTGFGFKVGQNAPFYTTDIV